jgi:hypothetical protein
MGSGLAADALSAFAEAPSGEQDPLFGGGT